MIPLEVKWNTTPTTVQLRFGTFQKKINLLIGLGPTCWFPWFLENLEARKTSWNREKFVSSSIIRTTFWEGYLSHSFHISISSAVGRFMNSPGCQHCCNVPSNCEADVTLGASFTIPSLPSWTPGTGGKLSVSWFQSWKGSGTNDAPQKLCQSTENNHIVITI